MTKSADTQDAHCSDEIDLSYTLAPPGSKLVETFAATYLYIPYLGETYVEVVKTPKGCPYFEVCNTSERDMAVFIGGWRFTFDRPERVTRDPITRTRVRTLIGSRKVWLVFSVPVLMTLVSLMTFPKLLLRRLRAISRRSSPLAHSDAVSGH
ncbi:hypothetical protein [Methylovirgula sp. 4M-Z18]|uniref:hypothetical protein n=1 Tax=Methylovirgula sp. 4M-Z18 TaxID=2293567 RepID=UPI000E2FC00D|nr:hypothetical protein [Methylovirgula sp. 4M-Z18]RFB78318.1 hypothetical protein DYH55_16340 [Methylovirgula sp. 4M-Z18]